MGKGNLAVAGYLLEDSGGKYPYDRVFIYDPKPRGDGSGSVLDIIRKPLKKYLKLVRRNEK